MAEETGFIALRDVSGSFPDREKQWVRTAHISRIVPTANNQYEIRLIDGNPISIDQDDVSLVFEALGIRKESAVARPHSKPASERIIEHS